jgi:hypothetical protein
MRLFQTPMAGGQLLKKGDDQQLNLIFSSFLLSLFITFSSHGNITITLLA